MQDQPITYVRTKRKVSEDMKDPDQFKTPALTKMQFDRKVAIEIALATKIFEPETSRSYDEPEDSREDY